MLRRVQANTISPMRRMATYQSRYGYTMLPPSRSYYDVLKVPINSSGQEIKRAFIELSKKYHPDGNSHTRDSDEFVKVCEAYKILYKRASREHYNNRLKTRFRMVPPMDSSYTNKNVHKAWVKYQAAMRYKQFGHDVPSFAGSTILHKRSLLIKARGVRLLPAGHAMTPGKYGNEEVIRFPYFFDRSYENWMYIYYMAGFGLIGVLLAVDAIKKANPTTGCDAPVGHI
ncbi:uncharacterized protein LOC135438334 [Drosophila montana]|uniref:uncharacterized protein LOC135438334 n=1 Tax=Drosophila montana TaxID=40370 RepID=UPI00313C522B